MAYQIGKLAHLTGVPAETIRYYEREGLVGRPPRTAGNYRVYGDSHRERLSFIRHCRSLDLSIEEIRLLLRVRDSSGGCEDVNSVLDQHIDHVTKRLAELRILRRQLIDLRQSCSAERAGNSCGILSGLSAMARRTKPGREPVKPKRALNHVALRSRRPV
jgi:Cd(II)/Pb(II)-responsive transcriptional regulator